MIMVAAAVAVLALYSLAFEPSSLTTWVTLLQGAAGAVPDEVEREAPARRLAGCWYGRWFPNGHTGCGERGRIWTCHAGTWRDVAACGDCWSPQVKRWFKHGTVGCHAGTNWACAAGTWKNLGACKPPTPAKPAPAKPAAAAANEVAKSAAADVAAKAAAAKAAKAGKTGGSGWVGTLVGVAFGGSFGVAVLLWCLCRPSRGEAGDAAGACGGGYCATLLCCTCCGLPCPLAHMYGLEVGGECAAAVMADHVAGKVAKIAWEESDTTSKK